MKKQYLIIAMSTLLLASCGNKVFKSAETHYNAYEFAVAARLYETTLKSDSSNAVAILHLADCYRQMNRHAEAEKWYSKGVSTPEATPQDKLNYAEVLKENGKYSEAQKWFDAYLMTDPTNSAVINSKESCKNVPDLSIQTPYYIIEEVNVTGFGSVFCPSVTGDKVMVAAESKLSGNETPSNWTGNGYIDLYTFNPSAPGELTPVSGVNSNLNDGPGVVSSDGRYLFFTRNLLREGKAVKAEDRDNHLEICVAEKANDGSWTNVRSLPFNSPDFSCGHPSLTPDGMRLYFTSDMPGGLGGTDIYYSDYADGKWGAPVNPGECINTNGNEMFPSVNTIYAGFVQLYYASDGMQGLGGFDLYESQIVNGACSRGRRMDVPFNSAQDDFGITYNADGKSGYFTSNRGSAEGIDRIYSFKKIDPQYFVKVDVKQKETSLAIPNSPVEILNSRTGVSTKYTTDANGSLLIPADSVTSYAFTVRKDGYFTGFGSVNTGGFHGQFFDTSAIVIVIDQIVLNKPIRLDNIYYDYDKWAIRPDAAIELDKLVKIMVDNPAIKIELSSHTDCRGSDKYNETLSQKRAQSAVDYIVSKGIAKDRITAKGYGEKQLLNKCDDGVKCTEEEHQWNRRTEFKVTHIAVPDAPVSQ